MDDVVTIPTEPHEITQRIICPLPISVVNYDNPLIRHATEFTYDLPSGSLHNTSV